MNQIDVLVYAVKNTEWRRPYRVGKSRVLFKTSGGTVWVNRGDGWRKVIKENDIDTDAIKILARIEKEGFTYE